jgi:hypothetical protein
MDCRDCETCRENKTCNWPKRRMPWTLQPEYQSLLKRSGELFDKIMSLEVPECHGIELTPEQDAQRWALRERLFRVHAQMFELHRKGWASA